MRRGSLLARPGRGALMTKRRAFLASLLLVVMTGAVAWGSDLPINFQAVFLLRVMAYDRNLKSRAGDAVSVLIAYREGNRSSESAKADLQATLVKISKESQVADLPVQVATVAYRKPADLEDAITSANASALYVCPGLEDMVQPISEITRKKSVLTFTGVESWIKLGLSIGLVARAGKPAIIVNLPVSKEEGADLDPALLRLAEVLR